MKQDAACEHLTVERSGKRRIYVGIGVREAKERHWRQRFAIGFCGHVVRTGKRVQPVDEHLTELYDMSLYLRLVDQLQRGERRCHRSRVAVEGRGVVHV